MIDSPEATSAFLPTAVVRFAEDIRAAFKLREMLFQRELDRKFVLSQGRICYALDTSILHRYFQDRRAEQPAVQIFKGPAGSQPSPSEERVFDIVTTDLVQNLAPRDGSFSPLLILPGHIDETRSLHEHLLSTISRSRSRRQAARATLVSILETVGSAPPERQRAVLTEHEGTLHDLLYAVEESNERLARFNDLLATGRLRSTIKIASDPAWHALVSDDPQLLPILQGELGSSATDKSEGGPDWWQRRLDKMPTGFVSKDKTALATLDRLNRCLKPRNIRVVLFTDNEEIARQGRRYRPFRHVDSDWRDYNFTDLYIRHPKALLFEPEVLLPSDTGDKATDAGWLDAFLSQVIGSDGAMNLLSFRAHYTGRTLYETLEDVAEAALQDWPQAHAQLHADWIRHVDRVTLAHVATSSIARGVIRQRLGLAGEAIPDLGNLDRQIQDLTEDSWDSFYMTAARSGYEMIGLSLDKVRGQKRNVPILFLRDLPLGEALLDLIYEVDGVIRNEVQIRELLGQIDDLGTRTGRYVAALGYSVLFAYADRWSVARALAVRAVEIAPADARSAEVQGEPADRVTGREACFLACVTHRLTARTRTDLPECERYLKRARHLLALEMGDPDTSTPRMTGVRFAGEAIAIQTARTLFDAHAVGWELAPTHRLVDIARSTNAEARSLLEDADVCRDERVRRSTYSNVRTNLVANLFVLECAGALAQSDLNRLSALVDDQLRDWRMLSSSDDRADVSAIDLQSLSYATSLLRPGEKDRTMSRLEALAAAGGRSNTFLMPYDRSRYDRMAVLARARENA